MLARELLHAGDEFCGLGPLERATRTAPVVMGREHDFGRVVAPNPEHLFENPDDELHRRIVIVEQKNPKVCRAAHIWRGRLRRGRAIAQMDDGIISRHALLLEEVSDGLGEQLDQDIGNISGATLSCRHS